MMRHDVSRVLGILKQLGSMLEYCRLEYMKAESWSEDEEYRTASCCLRYNLEK
ncbi:hypothetical protein YC2023_112776 [Brassica napus]